MHAVSYHGRAVRASRPSQAAILLSPLLILSFRAWGRFRKGKGARHYWVCAPLLYNVSGVPRRPPDPGTLGPGEISPSPGAAFPLPSVVPTISPRSADYRKIGRIESCVRQKTFGSCDLIIEGETGDAKCLTPSTSSPVLLRKPGLFFRQSVDRVSAPTRAWQAEACHTASPLSPSAMAEDDPNQKMRAFDDEVALTVAPFYLVHMLQRTLPAGFIAPCLPTKTDKLPSGRDWLHEIKHDGFRIIARKTGAQVRLYSRPGNDLTRRFPLRRDPLEVRKATLASIVAKASPASGSMSISKATARPSSPTPASFASKASFRSARIPSTVPAAPPIGSK